MAEAEKGSTVKVHYTGKLQDGTVFDTSKNIEPIQFVVGSGEIIKGFEQAVIGMACGENKTVTIPCNEAYGPKREDLVAEVNRGELPPDLSLTIGQKLQIGDQESGVIIVSVVDMDDNTVKLDANHPLAGEDLIFEIELLEVN
ncbi:MAG TPA: peptidylprolyl isomerase [Chlamydiales bacterium]|nr:peptidylprolyl isomerase [Chlamydiales bacterium]HPE85512.1 peptidylprolyl isomerase [Chlamydiales bacterium]